MKQLLISLIVMLLLSFNAIAEDDVIIDGILESYGTQLIQCQKVTITINGYWIISSEDDKPDDPIDPDIIENMPYYDILMTSAGTEYVGYGWLDVEYINRRIGVNFSHVTHKYLLDTENCIYCHHNSDSNATCGACGECHKAENIWGWGDNQIISYEDVCHILCKDCHIEYTEENNNSTAPTQCMTCHNHGSNPNNVPESLEYMPFYTIRMTPVSSAKVITSKENVLFSHNTHSYLILEENWNCMDCHHTASDDSECETCSECHHAGMYSSSSVTDNGITSMLYVIHPLCGDCH